MLLRFLEKLGRKKTVLDRGPSHQNFNEDRMKIAAEKSQAHEFINSLSQGYDTLVGERGQKLSVGQKQRLSIARAIYKDPPILIFDEATSAVDNQTEHLIQNAILEASKGRTTIVIAHRLATVKKADRIVVMEEGQIVAEGTHNALISEDGLYARLAALQFDKTLEE